MAVDVDVVAQGIAGTEELINHLRAVPSLSEVALTHNPILTEEEVFHETVMLMAQMFEQMNHYMREMLDEVVECRNRDARNN